MRNIKDVSICRLLNRANAEAAISDCLLGFRRSGDRRLQAHQFRAFNRYPAPQLIRQDCINPVAASA